MNSMLRKAAGAAAIVLSVALVAGCGSAPSSTSSNTKSIRVGTSPGPYSELFKKGAAPVLQKEGYTIKYTSFSDLQTADVALNEGSVDLNVDQHTAYINAFNKNKGGDLVPLQAIPTVPAGLYSQRHKSLKDVASGDLVAISQDPSNESRGLRLLEKIGWITLKPDADPVTVTPNDIATNPKNLQIKPMDSATIPRSLGDLDYAVIPGSVSYSSKVDPKLQLAQEKLKDEYLLQVTVKKANKDATWAKDVVKAYKFKEFLDYLGKNNTNNYWFVPESLKQ
ncbi:MAG: MetQ/NlpA family ABC transporter substrate-binding protein [Bifidobacterium tibiigranuli]|jgi:D-methionine transport system substrate-binding protein|uniref:MetQ/NlpA family ABC transporter substrate-binding protein n=1 Tax=Bifidobacterium tibiigranuli TaxID=2172043 RepID=UPI0026EC1BEF|nr:MetQ/NlpA family ABC transporter substrate-binding protein [Bifidobacterium tibiigranuli]MCI1673915.1 MetQ/NlpA family ABC transporter substrate-binding protein [Bifidobacterium tibiigranuli]MCI1712164.1 MetQ/NlpA family ABC transporter substrate-binding protein [Bifidobacterium tibiigranuli]MCI1834276.1 MetQ/NlpA family ABC transporter substrate-binding protein [Bifidobacterium tibiigranuli]